MKELAVLSEEARKLALDRFRLLRPHLEENQALRSVALMVRFLNTVFYTPGAPPISAAVDEREHWDPHFPLERRHVRRLHDVFAG